VAARSRDPYNFGSTVGYPSDSLASCWKIALLRPLFRGGDFQKNSAFSRLYSQLDLRFSRRPCPLHQVRRSHFCRRRY